MNGVLIQQKKTSGYDCGEQLNCFPSKDGGGYSLVPVEMYADLTLSEKFVVGGGHHFIHSFMKKYDADVGFPLIQETEPWGISLVSLHYVYAYDMHDIRVLICISSPFYLIEPGLVGTNNY